jgi:hypothetical protein
LPKLFHFFPESENAAIIIRKMADDDALAGTTGKENLYPYLFSRLKSRCRSIRLFKIDLFPLNPVSIRFFSVKMLHVAVFAATSRHNGG